MSYPSNRGNEFNNITQEKLDSMSTAELLELLESINETMTEDNFDDELITACLDALDRKSPMPEYPSTERAWRSFEDKVELDKRASGGDSGTTANRPKRGAKRALRTGLVAAIIVFCLFSCMLVAQAAGVDVFGSIARWTDSVFGFGLDEAQAAQEKVPSTFAEYVELLKPEVPEGFTMSGPYFYQGDLTGYGEVVINYYSDTDFIMFTIIESPGNPDSLYEKDSNNVEIIDVGNHRFYMFSNNESNIAACQYEQYEFGITTSLSKNELISIVKASYSEGV